MISLSCLRSGHLSFTTPLYVREREAGHSFSVMASKLWNSLPLKLRTSRLITKENFNHQKLRKITGGKKVFEPYICKKISRFARALTVAGSTRIMKVLIII